MDEEVILLFVRLYLSLCGSTVSLTVALVVVTTCFVLVHVLSTKIFHRLDIVVLFVAITSALK